MKKTISILIFMLAITAVNAKNKEIIANVVFENFSNKTVFSGNFHIEELHKNIMVTTIENFKIALPSKGKYKFSFTTDIFLVSVSYPKRITSKNKTIKVMLLPKYYMQNVVSETTNTQIEARITEQDVNFIVHGIGNADSEKLLEFKKMYGVGVMYKNCVIDPLSMRNARENNQRISKYLTQKYGKAWLSKLKIKPFGVK